MNKSERELEQLVNDTEHSSLAVPPLFELYATLFSICAAVMLLTFPNMTYDYPAALYDHMTAIMPQTWWAFSFFVAAMLKAVGLLIGKGALRIIGLIASAILYVLMTYCYAVDFPSIGTITFGCMTAFTIVSIPFVKHTSIKQNKE